MGVYKGLNSNSKLYGIWHGMKQRCNNPKHPCEEWKSIYDLWCRSMEEWANGTATANHFYGREGENK